MTRNTADDAGAVAAEYFRAWLAHDWTALRHILADDLTFQGPLAQLTGADACVDGLEGMSQIMTDIVIKHRWVDGADVLTWFDLVTAGAD